MCISISGHQRPIISKDKIMRRKPKKLTKMTRFPSPGFDPWPRTATWYGQMLYPLSCEEFVNVTKAQFLTYVLGVLRTAKIKPRNIGSIPKKEKKIFCNGLQLSQLVRSNFVHFDLLLFVMILSRGIYLLLFFFEYERVTSTLLLKQKHSI